MATPDGSVRLHEIDQALKQKVSQFVRLPLIVNGDPQVVSA